MCCTGCMGEPSGPSPPPSRIDTPLSSSGVSPQSWMVQGKCFLSVLYKLKKNNNPWIKYRAFFLAAQRQDYFLKTAITAALHLNDLRGKNAPRFFCFFFSQQIAFSRFFSLSRWARCSPPSCYCAADTTPREHKVGQYFPHWGCNKSKPSHYSSHSEISHLDCSPDPHQLFCHLKCAPVISSGLSGSVWNAAWRREGTAGGHVFNSVRNRS